MSIQQYPEYKETGVEWLEQIPKHWKICRFKWLLSCNDGGVWGNDPTGKDDTIVLRSTEQSVDGKWTIESPAYRQLDEQEKTSALLAAGDLLITKSSGSSLHIGKTTLVTEDVANLNCCYSNFTQRIRTKDKFHPKLAWYLLNNQLSRFQFDFLSNSTTGLANLNGTMIGQILIAFMPIEEQHSIIEFLDAATSKIDLLVTEQVNLIELLKEKRQAVISQVVTKGLNPTVKMKASKAVWLDNIPDHWSEIKGRRLFEIKKRIVGELGFQVLSITQQGIRPKDTQSNEGQQSMDYSKYQLVEIGDFAMNHMDLLTGYVDISSTVGVTSPDYRVFSLKDFKKCHPQYLLYLLQNCYINKIFYPFGQGSSQLGRWRLPAEQFKDFVFLLPPVEEQIEISAYISNQLKKLDELSTQAAKAIKLLQERRSCLVRLVLTGQIDVRNVAKKRRQHEPTQ